MLNIGDDDDHLGHDVVDVTICKLINSNTNKHNIWNKVYVK